jgi:putative nucleotidyltransferase with HDIG domain
VDYLTKPVSPSLALARVKTHTDLHQARLELKEWNSNLKGRVIGLSSLVTAKVHDLALVELETFRNREDWLDLLVRLLDMFDENLLGHASRVAALSVTVAGRVGCTASEVETIRLAALLHDIGKIGLPPEVTMTLPDNLTELQKRIYLSHAVRGQFLLSHIDWLHEAGVLIRHHHEMMDGSGLPDRLNGEEIPLGARIIAVADYIDLSASHIKSGTLLYSVLKNIKNQARNHFDQHLIAHFTEVAHGIFDKPELDKERSVILPLKELVPGMIMGERLFSGSQVLLIDRGESVTVEKLRRVKLSLEIDPPSCIEVLVNKAGP